MTKFRIDPKAVLDGAGQMNLKDVVVVCRTTNGRIAVFSNCSTPETLELLAKGEPHIEELNVDA